LPTTHSASDRRDAPARLPTRCARSTIPLASPAACVCPSPLGDSTSNVCGYLRCFCLRIQTCTTGCERLFDGNNECAAATEAAVTLCSASSAVPEFLNLVMVAFSARHVAPVFVAS